MSLRRAVLMLLTVYLTADYCDPSVPGVFFFGTESFFVESVESRSPARIAPPSLKATSPTGSMVTSLTPPALPATSADGPLIPRPYFARARTESAPRAAPSTADDH